jgi:hypothetical protein
MQVFLVSVVMTTKTVGHIPVRAESLEKAKAINLTQEQIAYLFNSHHSNQVFYELEINKTPANC